MAAIYIITDLERDANTVTNMVGDKIGVGEMIRSNGNVV